LSQTTEQVIELHPSELMDFCGRNDERLRELESQFRVRIVPRGNTLKVLGESNEVGRVKQVIEDLLSFSRNKNGLSRQQMKYAFDSIKSEKKEDLKSIFSDRVQVPLKKRSVAPMTATQKAYLDAIRTHDVVFGIGPAGTGKTYLAMAMAVHYLTHNLVRRIVLVRPAVEAGEKLGFLPGDIAAKFDPFVRPLYDALHDMVEPERAKMMLDNGVIEVAPLAFMRGRTLNNSFVILDEGQNTSIEQMKMFLTRLGYDSKAVITGDVTQIDLPQGKESGLVNVRRVLSNVPGISFVYFNQDDVVRHELVQKIIRAYERFEKGAVSGEQPELPLDTGMTETVAPLADDSGASVVEVGEAAPESRPAGDETEELNGTNPSAAPPGAVLGK